MLRIKAHDKFLSSVECLFYRQTIFVQGTIDFHPIESFALLLFILLQWQLSQSRISRTASHVHGSLAVTLYLPPSTG